MNSRENDDTCWYSVDCIFWLKGASTSKVIGARNEMRMDDYDGQMIVGDLVGLKLPDIRLTGEGKPRKKLTQETCPDRGSNPWPLRDRRACYHLFHSGELAGTESYHSSWQCKESHRCCQGPLAPLAMGNSGTSTVFRYESCGYDLFAKVKKETRCEGLRTTQEMNLSVL